MPLARVGTVLGTSDFDSTSMPAEGGRDRMFSGGIPTQTSTDRESVRAGPAASRNERLGTGLYRWARLAMARLFSAICMNSVGGCVSIVDGK